MKFFKITNISSTEYTKVSMLNCSIQAQYIDLLLYVGYDQSSL